MRYRRWALAIVVGSGLLALFVHLRGDDENRSKAPGERPSSVATRPASAISAREKAPAASLGDDGAPSREEARRLFVEVRSTKGDPIGGARVRIVGPGGVHSGVTDGEGFWVLEALVGPVFRFEAVASGYRAQSFHAPRLGPSREISWTFVLEASPLVEGEERPPTLRGSVSAAGAPVVGAGVFLVPGPKNRPAPVTSTDEAGRFVFYEDLSDADTVRALHPAHGEASVILRGQREVHLELSSGGYVEGLVLDFDGTPVPDFSLRATSEAVLSSDALRGARGSLRKLSRSARRQPENKARRDILRGLMRGVRIQGGVAGQKERGDKVEENSKAAAGTFRVGPLAAGKVTLIASAPERAPASVELELGEDEVLSGVVLRLEAPVVVTGQVTERSTKKPIAGARVQAISIRHANVPGYASARTDAEGRYRLTTAPRQRHSLRARARGYIAFNQGGVEGKEGDELTWDFELARAPRGKGGAHQREYVGIGAQLRASDEGAVITEVFSQGSARGVLEKGDLILRVDGVWVDDLPLTEVVEFILGEPGTEVDLLIRPVDQGGTEEVVLPRVRVRHRLR